MRNYKTEYENYHSKLRQKKRRAKRNKARRKAIRKLGKGKLRGKDIHHVNDDTLSGPTRIISKSRNRSFRRGKNKSNAGL